MEKVPFSGIYIDGLVQDCSNSSALAMELLQSCTKAMDVYIKYLAGYDCHNEQNVLVIDLATIL